MRRCRALLALGFVVGALGVATPSAVSAQDIVCDRGDRYLSTTLFQSWMDNS